MTLYLDCEKVETVELLRGDNAVVSTKGVTVFGTRLLDEEIFEVGHYEKIKAFKNTNYHIYLEKYLRELFRREWK